MSKEIDVKRLDGYKPAKAKKSSRWDWVGDFLDALTLAWIFDLFD